MLTYPSDTDISARVPEPDRIIAIFGPPGAGKTTVARALADVLGAAYISSGDIARELDPGALARGEMADRAALREGFLIALEAAGPDRRIVVDGLPRDPGDIQLLPRDETMFILLNCLPNIARERQLRRGRENDTPDLIDKRTAEQRALMELDKPDGWAWDLAPWPQRLATDKHRPEHVIRLVTEFVFGRRSTIG